MNTNKEFLTIRQLAKLGIMGEASLRMRLKQGKLPGFYCGNHFKVNVSMFKEMLDEESREAIRKE